MTWQLTVTNNYHGTIVALGIPIPGPDNRPHPLSQQLGNGSINIPGLGDINFTDIGNRTSVGSVRKPGAC